MIVSADFMKKHPDIRIYVNEFQLYDLTPIMLKECEKRRLLCKSYFLFFEGTTFCMF